MVGVVQSKAAPHHRRGAITVDLIVAMGILLVASLPVSYSFRSEQKLCRSYYYRALAMELVDGEMEVLAAGAWKNWKPGSYAYEVAGEAAQNLPPGRFTLTVELQRIRLEWSPSESGHGGPVVRECILPPPSPSSAPTTVRESVAPTGRPL